MDDIFLGVDAGGTKTHAAVIDRSGRILGLGVASTGNWERVGLEESGKALLSAIDHALQESALDRRNIVGATLALAGIDWESDRQLMKKVVNTFGLSCEPVIVNDAFAVLYAGTSDGIGCASIAGTGGKTVASDGTRELQTLGMAVGEGGGAGQIVSEGLRVIAEMYHGQRPITNLSYELLAASGHTSIESLFQAIARDGFEITEALSPFFFDLAHVGDKAAVEVIQTVARQHARDVIGIVRGLDFGDKPVKLVRAGGLHTASSASFNEAFNETIARSGISFESEVLEVVPVVGSLIHAAKNNSGEFKNNFRDRLFEDALKRDSDFRTTTQK
ncbi:MAG: hypothetical protein RIS75_1334 [Actinomycetota bacterium]